MTHSWPSPLTIAPLAPTTEQVSGGHVCPVDHSKDLSTVAAGTWKNCYVDTGNRADRQGEQNAYLSAQLPFSPFSSLSFLEGHCSSPIPPTRSWCAWPFISHGYLNQPSRPQCLPSPSHSNQLEEWAYDPNQDRLDALVGFLKIQIQGKKEQNTQLSSKLVKPCVTECPQLAPPLKYRKYLSHIGKEMQKKGERDTQRGTMSSISETSEFPSFCFPEAELLCFNSENHSSIHKSSNLTLPPVHQVEFSFYCLHAKSPDQYVSCLGSILDLPEEHLENPNENPVDWEQT